MTELVLAHGREGVSPAILLPSIEKALTPAGVVGFVDVAGARVFVGSAVGPAHDDAGVAPGQGRRCVVFGRELEDGEPVPDAAYVVGEEPWWDLAQWPETVRRSRSLRSQIRRAAHKGVQVRACRAEELGAGTPLRQAVEALIHAWLRTRHMPPLAFVASVDPFATLPHRRIFVAEVGGGLVGAAFAIPIGGRRAWLVDHVLRSFDAPNGTAELLVDATLRALAREGARWATLGLCPLAGPVPLALAWVLRSTRGLFDFRGLHAFKAKLGPQRWQRVLLEYPGQTAFLGTLRALRAFAGGSLVRFALGTALRGPPPLLRAVALLLVPWTFALSLPAAARFFPEPWMRWAWIGFDACVVAGLLWLAQRVSRRHRRRWLHRLLAVLVTADAVVTAFQAVAWNAPRAQGAADWGLIAVATAAPALVAPVLWSALRYRVR